MQLPEDLQRAVELEIEHCPHALMQRAADRMTLQYRSEKSSAALFSDPAGVPAYLAVRLPATFAAIQCVLEECARRLPAWQPRSMVDFGAGPGTGGWAAVQIFPSLRSLNNVERSPQMREIGQRIARQSSDRMLSDAAWSDSVCESADLTLLSYVVAEVNETERLNLVSRLWNQSQVVVVIEPGTPSGFQRILRIREWALLQGAQLIAPCPHSKQCPMEKFRWCHFPARVDRTRIHKLLKGATLGYEDEKFSYLVFGKIPVSLPAGRVVDSPKKNKGFVQISLCSDGCLKEIVVSRKENNYRDARDLKYGDSWM